MPAFRECLTGKTFCARCRRIGKHAFNSMDVEKYVDGGLNQNTDTAGVSLNKPDILVKLEIRQQELFVVEASLPGLNGFPLGCQEGVLSLISGGFDSAVSSYLSIRRGLMTHFCFFNLGAGRMKSR